MIEFKHGDCLELIKDIKSESVDCILTDPPYKYLKNQKLEVDFDEHVFFNEAKRVLKKSGFIVLFGRGTSFYRWNTMLADLGFVFKEEIIWDKRMNTLPGLPLQRLHETISIHTLGNGTILKVRVDYLEKKQFDLYALQNDIKRIASALNSPEIEDLKNYIEKGELVYSPKTYKNFFKNGFTERSRAAATLRSIKEGMFEASIIEVLRDHYSAVHPTQKPVRLLERLLAITTKKGDLVLDPFAGSFATGEACYNTDRDCILMEIDQEYFDNGSERMKAVMSVPKQNQLLFADEGN